MNMFEKLVAAFATGVFDVCNPSTKVEKDQLLKDQKIKIVINEYTGTAHIMS
jgi:hypothetical protein